MKVTILMLLLSVACAQAQLTDADGDGVFQLTPAQMAAPEDGPFSNRKLELILAILTTISGIVTAIYRSKAKQSETIAVTTIRGVENSGSESAKRAIAAEAASTGHTELVHKKVMEVTEGSPTNPPTQ